MAIELGPVRPPERKPGLSGRLGRGLLAGPRWLGRRTAEAAGVEEIARGAGLIRELAERLRAPQDRDLPIAGPDGRVDARETAFLIGVTEKELLERWEARRRNTARLAWACFLLGWILLAVWAWRSMAAPSPLGWLLSGLQVLTFCGVLFTLAFRSAWQNWQLRTRRMGTVVEFLRSPESFWPRC